jgi:hypothetical protein
LIVASGHEITMPDIRDDDPLTGSQSLTAAGLRSQAHPFPTLGCFLTEPTVALQPKFSVGSALGVEHLDACEIRMQNGPRCIEDLFVQFSRATRTYQLRSHTLKSSRGVKLCRQALLVSRRLSFERASLLL